MAIRLTGWGFGPGHNFGRTRRPMTEYKIVPPPGEDLVERVAKIVDGAGFRSAIHPDRRARNASLREKARHKARAILAEIERKTGGNVSATLTKRVW